MTEHGGVIRPGEEWLDTNGRPIQAHGGSVLFEDGTYYWYGENKERTVPGGDVWHWGVRCYSSTDLCSWTDEGLILPPDLDDPRSPLHPHREMERPHIVRHPSTGRYVCYVKVKDGFTQLTSTFVADRLLGPYRPVHVDVRPLGMDAGDFDLTVDADTGRGHYIFERVHSELIVADLDVALTGITGDHSVHFRHGRPPHVREAPAYFRRHGRHYLITSGTTGYYPNPSEVAVADDIHGPWTVVGDPHPGDATGTSFGSQISSVLKVPGKEDLYVAIGDRWLPHYTEPGHVAVDAFEEHFARLEAGEDPGPMPRLTVPDTANARYVWLPLRFEGERVVIDWRDEWSLEDFD
ncbi:family 43 glycosylhydrolase [Demequina sp. NBRC 110056]|uniref:family 43 glycosylhydrolase n=1 Tax=Demequina sp. NBRC 110056 TaxID=1570345 RepID=UPI001F171566|nr:family 43 glycosylhydrolase [Demequina sp. NBRC 110056]